MAELRELSQVIPGASAIIIAIAPDDPAATMPAAAGTPAYAFTHPVAPTVSAHRRRLVHKAKRAVPKDGPPRITGQ
ncbi:hypothetical protein GCM10027436_18140 [Actinophytocola sediminis]